MECPECQRQWQTFLSSVTLTAAEGVLERAPTSVTHVSTSAMPTLWSVSMSVLQATLNVVATVMMLPSLPKCAILLSRTKRGQASLKTMRPLAVFRLDLQSVVLMGTVLLPNSTLSIASAMLFATILETAVTMWPTSAAQRRTVCLYFHCF